MIGFVIIISFCVGVILRTVLYPQPARQHIPSKQERELNEILMQAAEDRKVESEIIRLAWQQYWDYIEAERGKYFIVSVEYAHCYHVIHPETAKYKNGSINKEIQDLYAKLCADEILNRTLC